MKRSVLGACCCLSLLWAGRATAHAPPIATEVFWIRSNGSERAVVRTNRGLIFQGEQPNSFAIACNDAYFVGLADVPPVVARDDGRLLIGTYQAGLVLSSPDHCDYTLVGGPIEGVNVVALARGAGQKFYAVVLPLDGSAARLFVSSGGEAFDPLATFSSIPSAVVLAPNEAGRVYVSASVAHEDRNAAVLLVSTDGGRAFVERPISLDAMELRAYVSAVDASDAERVFVRTQSRDGLTPERLLLSEDGGESFETVLTAPGPIVLYAEDNGIWAGTAQGLYRSTDSGRSFAAIGPAFITHIECVRRHDGALYVCGYLESQLAFGVLVSRDEGGTFQWFLQFPDVSSRIACDSRSLEGVFCAAPFADWSVEQGLAGSTATSMAGGTSASSGGTSVATGASGGAASVATGGTSASEGGASVAGGTSQSSAGAPLGGAGGEEPEVPGARRGSACALGVPAFRSTGWDAVLVMFGVFAVHRRRLARPQRR